MSLLSDWTAGLSRPDLGFIIDSGRHYKNAPIAEAIIEIRTSPVAGLEMPTLREAFEGSDLTVAERAIEITNQVNVDDENVTSESLGRQVGFVFRRPDGGRIVQSKLNSFALSWLPPYERWDVFVEEAERYWERYRSVVGPTAVTRIGVRFVNRIVIPKRQIEIKDYLRVAVDVPAYLPQGIASYFLQVSVPLAEFGSVATITSTIQPPSDETSGGALILDIDAWRETELDLSRQAEADKIPAVLNELRVVKNYVFESCITDATRGLID